MAKKRLKVLALSDKEAEQLARAEEIINDLVSRRLQNSNEHVLSLLAGLRIELMQELSRKRAAVKTLCRVAERVLGGDWYTLSYAIPNEEGKAECGKAKFTDNNGVERNILVVSLQIKGQEAKWVDPDEFPLFYDAETLEERHAALGLPNNCKLLTRSQLLCLHWIKDIYTEKQEAEQAGFMTVPNTPVTTALANISAGALKRKEKISSFEGDFFMITAKNGAKISINSNVYNDKIFLSPNTDKLLTQLNYKAVTSGVNEDGFVTLDIEEIMRARGVTDAHKLQKAIDEATNALLAIKVEYRAKNGSFDKGLLVSRCGLDVERGRRGVVYARFTPEYMAHINGRGAFFAKMPECLLKIPNNKPNHYAIACAMYRHKRNNVSKGNENELKISSLLGLCTFPAYDELRDKGQAAQLIMRPFRKVLEDLEGLYMEGYISYRVQYSKTNSKTEDCQLTTLDLERMWRDYSLFSSLVVHVDWIIEPDYDNIRKGKQRVKALEARAKQGKRSKQ